jgi:hypothetical protein
VDQSLPWAGWICDLGAGNPLPAFASATSLRTLFFKCSLAFRSFFAAASEGTLALSGFVSGLDKLFAKAEVPPMVQTTATTKVSDANLLNIGPLLKWSTAVNGQQRFLGSPFPEFGEAILIAQSFRLD